MKPARRCARVLMLAALGALAAVAAAQDENEPLLRLEAGGPTSYVTAVAFSPDGQTLYAGSWDKTVYIWRLDGEGRFQLDPASLRVPIGPGTSGALNTVAVSPDGRWVAAAGRALTRSSAGMRLPGVMLPARAMPVSSQLDEGTIHVFNTATREVRTLRGHRGDVRALAFVAGFRADRPLLLSAARERQDGATEFIGMVRAWDVVSERPLIASHPLPVPQVPVWNSWPKLAPRRTGNEAWAVEVGIAWGDELFRVWNLAQNRLEPAAWEGSSRDIVAYDPSTGRHFTGLVGVANGNVPRSFLQPWVRTAQGQWQGDAARRVDLLRAPNIENSVVFRVPRAVAAVGGAPGAASYLAVVAHDRVPAGGRDRYVLLLVDARQAAVIQAIPLWEVGATPRQPQIAAARGGQYVAITHDSEIRVLSVPELLAGRKQEQVLESVGATMTGVAFVRHGEGDNARLGLRLLEQPAAPGEAAGDLIFDIQGRTLAPRAPQDGWIQETPPASAWRTELRNGPDGKLQIRVTEDGTERGTIDLNGANRDRVQVVAVGNARPPLVAVASDHEGISSLDLYDAATGRHLRHLQAHSGLIHSVAASRDGRLLATAAEDQTVCVWKLTDLDRIVGRHGRADGVTVEAAGAQIRIATVGDDLRGRLAPGDVLVGRVVGAALTPFRATSDFYSTFYDATPGEAIVVRRLRGAQDQQDVEIPVSQGTDESKPLFSLFIIRGGEGGRRDWIGWSPLGPFESSNDRIERYLGWHFNPQPPDSRVTFAEIWKYRERYHKQGLLDTLVKTGAPPVAALQPVTRPRMSIVLNTGGPPLADATLLRAPPRSASLFLYDVSARDIASVELDVGGQVVAAERQADGLSWLAELDPARFAPGLVVARARVRTSERVPQEFVGGDRQFRYQPLPKVAITTPHTPGMSLRSPQRQFTFEATAEPGHPGQTIEITLSRAQGEQRQTVATWTTDRPLTIRQAVELGDGSNVLELVAKNRDALAGYEIHETVQQRLVVSHTPIAPPQVRLTNIETVRGDSAAPVDFSEGDARVSTEKLRLTFDVLEPAGRDPLKIEVGDHSVETVPSPPAIDKPSQVTVEIPATQGTHTVRVGRKLADAPLVDTPVRIINNPPLPSVNVEQPEDDKILVAGRDEPAVELLARLEGAIDKSLRAVILVNDSPLDVAPALDREARTLTARIPLAPGENRIAVQLTDDYNQTPQVTPVAAVKLLRLPTIAPLATKEPEPQATEAEATVSGQSATPITQLTVGGVLVPQTAVQYDAATGRFAAPIRAVRKAEPYELAVQAWNGDGPSLESVTWLIPARPVTVAPPHIELPSDTVVTQSEHLLEFRVRSQAPLRTLKVVRNHVPETVVVSPDLAAAKADASGVYEYRPSVKARLDKGINRFEVTAASDGAAAEAATNVSYTDTASPIKIEFVEVRERGHFIKHKVTESGTVAFTSEAVSSGKVWISGYITWPPTVDKSLTTQPQRIYVTVNEFQQIPAYAYPRKGDSTKSDFQAFAVLNKNANNVVRVTSPDLPSDLGSVQELRVDCKSPISGQRLHLLVIGVGVTEEQKHQFHTRVIESLHAKKEKGGELSTAAFSTILPYEPLVGDVSPRLVNSRLDEIKAAIDDRYRANERAAAPQNDVVMIYLQGGQIVPVDPDFFVTTSVSTNPRLTRALSTRDPRLLSLVAIHSRTLAEFLTRTAGAHVLMLDVSADPADERNAQWPGRSSAAMLRYTWLKGPEVPSEARLLAALPESVSKPGTLAHVDKTFAEFYQRLVARIPDGIRYRPQVPENMRNLRLGEAAE